MWATPSRSGSGPSLGNRWTLSSRAARLERVADEPGRVLFVVADDDDSHDDPPVAGISRRSAACRRPPPAVARPFVWCQTICHDGRRRPDRPRHVGAGRALRRVRPAAARGAGRLARRGAAELGFLVRPPLRRHRRRQPGRRDVLLGARDLLRGADRRGHGGPAHDHRHRPARAHQAPQDRVRRLLGPGGRGLPALRRGAHRAGPGRRAPAERRSVRLRGRRRQGGPDPGAGPHHGPARGRPGRVHRPRRPAHRQHRPGHHRRGLGPRRHRRLPPVPVPQPVRQATVGPGPRGRGRPAPRSRATTCCPGCCGPRWTATG